MPAKTGTIRASLVVVDRDNRQRSEIKDVADLQASIERLGVLQPIILDKNQKLIAGERRLTACRAIDPEYKIPYTLFESLDNTQQQIVELDENLRRSDLHWKDHAKALETIHALLEESDSDWSVQKTAEYLGLTGGHVSKCLKVAEALSAGDTRIQSSDGLAAAYNILRRDMERAVDNEMNEVLDVLSSDNYEPSDSEDVAAAIVNDSKGTGEVNQTSQGAPRITANIMRANFIKWLSSYNGRKFNFLHCDFPYGINHGNSSQGGTASGRHAGYADGADVYWELCQALADNLDKILYPSAHVMFWFSMEYYTETIEFFSKHAPSLEIQNIPLVWHKTDNKGIVKDVERRPRNVYETALVMSRGDRKIIQPVANTYGCPTSKDIHVSEKPEPMLRHFFRMFVDHHSEVLDPTCGSGTAIRVAAVDRKAKRALGLELDEDFAEQAQRALTRKLTMDKFAGDIAPKGETND